MSVEILSNIEKAFPFIEKPQGLEFSFHKDDCFQCRCIRKEVESYGKQIDGSGLRWLHNEMSCLSSKGLLWLLPSLLRHCVLSDETYDGRETEFLIYHLSPNLKFQKDVIKQFSAFNKAQIECLQVFIEWCASHEHWSNYCSDEIQIASDYLKSHSAVRKQMTFANDDM